MMSLDVLRILAVLFTALALVPAGAHVLELPNKMTLSRDEYLIAQRLYRGWQLVGVVVIAALLATFALAAAVRSRPEAFQPAVVACACVAGTQLVFWVFTFPVNRRTANWTMAPPEWQPLRNRWEYSHAVSAMLNLTALVATTLAATRGPIGS
jgi:hypothetical protein